MPRRVSPFRISVVLGIAGVILIAGAGPAAAEGDLQIEADAVYELEPEESRLAVTVSFVLTNQKAPTTSGGVTTYYYYDSFSILLPDEAVEVTAIDDHGRRLHFTEATEEIDDEGTTGRVMTVLFPRWLYRAGHQTIILSFHLPGGEPRSESAVRANPAYGAFGAWAWGDPGLSDVTVRIPTRFVVYGGDDMDVEEGEDITTWHDADIEDPAEWGVFFTARYDEALVSEVMEVEGLTVTVSSWPGDDIWRERVIDVVRRGLPELKEEIGLDFGDQTTLQILEALDPTLLGYAGWYITEQDVIELGEDLDDHTILHEVSHLWVNDDLFITRWITEGLAEVLAATAFDAIDGQGPPLRPSLPATSLPFAVALNRWDLPDTAPTEDDDSFEREDYGYNASYWVMRKLRDEIGTEGLQAVLAAAASDLTAYQDGTDPEIVTGTDGWWRFLDLIEEIGGSTGADELFRDFVTAPEDVLLLDERIAAREAYATLLVADTDWETPWAVREPLGEWEFPAAEQTITSAHAVVTLRDQIEEIAAELDLTPPPELEDAYEDAQTRQDLTAATAIGEDQLESVTAVETATAAVAAERGFFETIGLIGEDPDAPLLEAAAAFEEGRHDDVGSLTAEVVDLIDNADDIGQGRVVRTATATLLLAAAVFALVVVLRGQGRYKGEVEAAEG